MLVAMVDLRKVRIPFDICILAIFVVESLGATVVLSVTPIFFRLNIRHDI